MNSTLKKFLVCTILFILSICTYSNSLHNEFLIDDHGLILHDTLVQNPRFALLQFIPNLMKSLTLDGRSNESSYYRPFAHIILSINYFFFKNNTFGYHATNLVLFFLACLVIYFLLLALLDNENIALLTSALFCVHPINGLMVNYITASVFALQIIFMSLCFIFFLKVKKIDFFLSVLFFILALLCHETALMLPFYLGAYIVYKNTKPALNPFTKLIPFLIIFVCYFVFRLKFASLKSSMLDKIIGLDINFFEYTATYTKLLVQYFKNIFTLNDIVLIWMTDVVKSSLFFWNTIFLFLVSFSVFIFYKLLKNFAWAFALSILIIGFLPISLGCLFRANEGLMIEPHWLFFPSIGLFTFLAMLLLKLSLKMHQITFCLLMIGLLTTNITSSRIYNYLWKNEIRYCIYWQSIVPQYRWISFHIANSYQKQKNNTLAEYYYLKAITNQISDFQIYTNLGLIKLSEGNELKAVNYFDKALFINPYSSEALNNLALVYIQHQDLSKAKKLLLKAVEINSYQLETNLNLAGIYIKEGAWSEAENLYLKNLENDPRDFETKYNLIKLYLRFQKNPRMVDLANDILKHDTSAEQLTQIGTLFAYYKIPNLPRVFYNQALHVNPRYLEAYLEMGKLLGNENKFDEALTLWTKGLSLNPNDDRLIKLIKEAKRIQNLTK